MSSYNLNNQNTTKELLINLLLMLVMAIFFSLLSTKAFGGQVKLAWDTKLANSTTMHLIKYGTTSRNYTSTVNVGDANTYTVSDLQDGAAYYFAVTAFDSAAKVESTSSNEILYKVPGTPPAVTVNYTANPTTGTAPLAVTFQNTSTGNVTGWQWDFGDSTTSPAQNPVKVYGSPGTYTVSLKATSSAGTLIQTKQNFIQVAAPAALPPVAAFTATPTSGTTPLVVNFTNSSSGSINSWNWNFGDGATSTVQAPSHTYNTTGNYTVTLNVAGPGGSSTKTGSISVIAGGSGGIPSGSNPSGLVAAYGFEEDSGVTVVDASGKGNHGTKQYTKRIANGRFGKALSFDGVSSLVTVKDSNSLDLTAGMTLEAWVYNTNDTNQWSTVIWKETTGDGVYYLYGSTDSYGPAQGILIGSNQYLYGTDRTPTNAWVHLAATYDGQYQRLYVNGKQVSAQAQQGAIPISRGVLRIGADIWGDFFQGYIDEVRIYNRALTPQEVIGDLNKSIDTANPPQPVYGNQNLGPTVDELLNGTAVAFKSVAQASSMITGLNIYLDVGSTSTQLIAGIYSDRRGHPDTLLTSGTLALPHPGAWNSLKVPPILLGKGKAYWIALMSPNGTIQFADYVGTAGSEIESSASHVLTNLPSKWITGTLTFNGPVSGYGLGY